MTIALFAILLAQAQTVTKTGIEASYAQAVQGVTGGVPIPVSGSLSVAGTADTAGNTATYNANNVCSSVITAGEQSVGFHLTAGTLDATLTPYVTNQTGAINCATAGTCTATTFSSGSTIAVTNPSGVKDVGVNLVGGVRQVQVCTTTYASGSASGVVTATFLQAASSGGGGGGSVTQGTDPWLVAGKGTAGTPSGGVVTVQGVASMTAVKTDGSATTQPVSGTVAATQSGTWTVQPGNTANTTAWKVDGSAVTQPVSGTVTTSPPANASTNIAQVGGSSVTTLAAGEQKVGVEGLGASGAAKSGNPVQVGGIFNTTQPTVTTGQTVEAQATARGELMVAKGVSGFSIDNTGFNVNNSPTVNQGTANTAANAWPTKLTDGTNVAAVKAASTAAAAADPSAVVGLSPNSPLPTGSNTIGALTANQSVNTAQVNGVTTQTGAGTAGTGTQRVAIADSDGVVLATANSGRLQVDVVTGGGSNASVSATGSAPPASATYAGASVTTAAPTYTNGQMSGLSLNTAGGLRIDEAQVGGTAIDTNTGNASAGTQRVVLASNQPTIPVTQGGAATIFAGQQPLQPYAVAAALPSQAAKQVCFRNLSTSPDYVWLGSSSSVNSTNGQPFAPGEGDCRNIANANQLFFFTMAGATIGYDGTN